MKITPIIGLEVHVELATASKMFCGCPADHFGKPPNIQTCPVCLGLPGALPVPNKKAVEWTIILAQALDCKINLISKFDRKNYFYPDLPKGYQITQYDQPFGENGKLGKIRIRRVHLEEDTGKLQHEGQQSLVDFNRSGVPLVEIVTEPDFRSVEEVDVYLKKLQRIIRYLGISSADMEKGSMRLEPSISLSNDGSLPNYRVEVKNINSFRFVRMALEYEIKRQQKEPHIQQTRGWSEAKNATVPQREKEEAHDYRYFPDPDIPPIRMSNEQLAIIKEQIPELPEAKLTRFVKQYNLSQYAANILTDDKNTADYFEEAAKLSDQFADIANWIINKKADITTLVPAQLVEQIKKSQTAMPVDKTALEQAIKTVLSANPKAVADYKKGKTAVIGFFLGKISQAVKIPANDMIRTVLERMLNAR
ncbi:MAG: Asp-tRNA(Asn)/Glu-tRNA(Gln) amidotransferase subunit GatB [Patescibacteria group bacterium]|nr:Asp-tRNA(Asn)/Glu-tRNA(Gln) amidotransferase subunit GatB [Patescibacteria group bacterium]MCL5432330.1 Asp-tRNA(Asn)/Glu-tRNA(Gln) amidotransferase subunit GatB [Patescibacteria group bacterium]